MHLNLRWVFLGAQGRRERNPSLNCHSLIFGFCMKRKRISLLQTKDLITRLCYCSQLLRHPSDELLAGPQSIPASGAYIRDIRDGWDGLARCVMGMDVRNGTQTPGSKGKEYFRQLKGVCCLRTSFPREPISQE